MSDRTANKIYTAVMLGLMAAAALCAFSASAATCGDGVIEDAEQCDDAGTAGGDGCSAVCAIEANWSCAGQPSQCYDTLRPWYENDLVWIAGCLIIFLVIWWPF